MNFAYKQKSIPTLQLNTSRIHPNSKKRDRNLSPSKIVTFLYVDTRHWSSDVVVFAVGSCPLGTHLSRSSKRKNKKKFGVSIIVVAYIFFFVKPIFDLRNYLLYYIHFKKKEASSSIFKFKIHTNYKNCISISRVLYDRVRKKKINFEIPRLF